MDNFIVRKIKTNLADKNFNEILVGSFFSMFAKAGSMISALIVSMIVARVYGADMVGILGIINSFAMILGVIALMGTNTAILRLIPEHMINYSAASAFHIYKKIQWIVILLSIAVGGVFFLLSDFLAIHVFHKPHLGFYLSVTSLFIVFKSLMDLNISAVRGLKMIRTFAVIHLLPNMSMILLLAGMFFLLKTQDAPVYAQIGAWMMTTVFGIVAVHSAFIKKTGQPEDSGNGKIEKMSSRLILSLSSPMMMTATMNFLMAQPGIIILGMFRTDAEVGYYSMAMKLAMITSFVLQVINSMTAPKFSELFYKRDMDELFRVARKSAKMIFWFTIPLIAVLFVFGEHILIYGFGKEFEHAYFPLLIIVMGQFVNTVSGPTGIFMDMTGNQKAFRNIMFLCVFINILFSILLLSFGIVGISIAFALTLSLWNILVLIFIKKTYGRSISFFNF